MKTASKLLSMLLLVAMCLSLMGGSAYATGLAPLGEAATQGLAPLGTDDSSTVSGSTDSGAAGSSTFDLKPLSDDADSSTTFDLDKPSTLTAEKNIWNGLYADLVTAAQNTTSIKLHDDAVSPAKDPGGTISRSVVIDLNDKVLTLDGILTVNANITIKNGKLTNANKITVGKGYTVTFENVDLNGKDVIGEGESTEAKEYIATIGSEKFATMDEAFAYAAMQTGTVTINVIDDSSKLKDYTVTALPSVMSCDAIVLNLGKNCLKDASGSGLEVGVPFTINGGTIVGGIVANSNVSLNSTEVTGGVSVGGKTLTVNSSKVDVVGLYGGTLVMGSGSEIGSLQLAHTEAQNILKVSGGKVKEFIYTGGSSYRAITGGEWYVNDGDDVSLEYLRACVADGLTLKGTKNPYTVGEGAGTGSGSGSGGVDNGFTYTLYGSPYTKNSTGTVYVDISAQSTNGYWIGTKADATNAQQISSINYSLSANGTGYRLTFTNSYLNSLASGTYYLFAVYGGNTVRMCSTTNPLVITGSDSITVNPGTAAVWPVDSSLWYSGDGTYYFYVTPSLQLVDGKTYDYYDVRIDDVLLGGDKFTYNGYQKFGIAASVMDNLTVGNTHTLTVLTPAGYASCNFRIGATLRPVDTDKHVTGSSKNLQFVCSDAISRVWIGSNELTNLNYGDYWTLSSSGKTITLTAKLMNTQLVAGNTYTLTVQTANGDTPSCSFKILTTAQASASPQTGDESNLALWALVLVLTGGAAVAILPRLKKHEN